MCNCVVEGGVVMKKRGGGLKISLCGGGAILKIPLSIEGLMWQIKIDVKCYVSVC
jgi:hypothetical protein